MFVSLLIAAAILVVMQLALPRKWAFLPLIIAGCHLGNREILPELTAARLLIIVGLARALTGGFFVWPKKSKLDAIFIIFSVWAVLSSVGHQADAYIPSPLNARLGLVINSLGTYLYARSYLPDLSSFKRYACILPLILIPLALLMSIENRTRRNLYYALGARSEFSMIREDRIRAQGPFQHPILAGCAGSTALPFVYLAWRLGRKKNAIAGAGGCMGTVLASASSGPLAAVVVTMASIGFWRWRDKVKHVLWGLVAVAVLFNIVKGRGPWYLMASIDLVGGSTGWHRAKLIDQGFHFLNEWWFMGTDYTRHWMASGVRWNPNMVDLTNYYLHLGVTGGLPLTLCVFGFLIIGFKQLAARMRQLRELGDPDEIVLWCAGAALATHAVSFVSISYFDQMYIFFYILIGAIPGLVTSPSSVVASRAEPAVVEPAATQPKPLRFYS